MARRFRVRLHRVTVSRLLIECNRSVGHPRLFSEFTRSLPPADKNRLLDLIYHPHRAAVQSAVKDALRDGHRAVHIGVHSFTPILNGKERKLDVGLLFDSSRPRERIFCEHWRRAIRERQPALRIHFNHPYRGSSDGLTTTLRGVFPAARYLGLELELNQCWIGTRHWATMCDAVVDSLWHVLGS